MIIDAPSFVSGNNANDPIIGWHTIVTPSNVAAGTEDPLWPAENLANPSTAAFWRAANTTDQNITVTAGSAVDYVAIEGHNLGSAGVPLTLRGDTGAGYADIIAQFTPVDDSPLLFRFNVATYTGIRLRLNTGGADPAQIAVMHVGRLLTIPRRIYVGYTPLAYGRRTQATNAMSESGNFLGRIVTGETRGSAVAIRNIPPAWYRTYFDPFVAARTPFFFGWRPGAYPAEISYAWLTSDAVPVNQRHNGMMEINLDMGATA